MPETGRYVEITSEMVEAGVAAISPWDAEFLDHHEKVELILRAVLPLCPDDGKVRIMERHADV